MSRAHRRLRHAGGLQPLRGRLGARDGHAVPVDEAGRLALGRHAQRHDRALAERIKAKGEVRNQFHHVIDVAADGARGRRPAGADVRQRRPADAARRASRWRYSFDDAAAAERRETQYFEMFCNRGIYHKGWTAVTRHSTPWVMAPSCRRSTTTSGSSTARTTGRRRTTSRRSSPRSWRELQRLFLIEAAKYNVLPLDDRRVERFNPDLAGRPQLVHGQLADPLRRHGPADRELGRRDQEQVARVTAEIVVPEGGASGVIIAQGGAFGGWSLYAQGRQAGLLLQPLRPAAVQGLRRDGRSRPASTRCAWSSPTTAAASARAARRRSTSTATRSARGASTRPCRWSSRPTRRPTSASTAARR